MQWYWRDLLQAIILVRPEFVAIENCQIIIMQYDSSTGFILSQRISVRRISLPP